MIELQDETNNGTATISVTPRATRRSIPAWIVLRVAIPNATSVGAVRSTSAARAVTWLFLSALPPCANISMPVAPHDVAGAAAQAIISSATQAFKVAAPFSTEHQ